MPAGTPENPFVRLALTEGGAFSVGTPMTLIGATHEFSRLPLNERIEWLSSRNEVLTLFGVDSLSEIPSNLVKIDDEDDERIAEANRLFCEFFGFKGSNEELARIVKKWAEDADETLIYEEQEAFPEEYQTTGKLEVHNDILAAQDPLRVLSIAFDPKQEPKTRFEAKRKYVFMNLAAREDQHEKDSHLPQVNRAFLAFANDFMFASDRPRVTHTVLSEHDPETMSALSAEFIRDGDYPDPETGHFKLTPREFRTVKDAKGRAYQVYFDPREKDKRSKRLKRLRKELGGDPSSKIRDDLAYMFAVEDQRHMWLFIRHLLENAQTAGILVRLREVELRPRSNIYQKGALENSQDPYYISCYLEMHGAEIELMTMPPIPFLDYELHDEYSHDVYSAIRVPTEVTHPNPIYDIDHKRAREERLAEIRSKNRTRRRMVPMA